MTNPLGYTDWPPASVQVPPQRWLAADSAPVCRRFVTALKLGSALLLVTARQVEMNGAARPDGFSDGSDLFDAISSLDPEISFETRPLTGVDGAAGEYLIYVAAVDHLAFRPTTVTATPQMWRPAHDEVPGSRFITALLINDVMIHLFAHQMNNGELTEWPEDLDAISGMTGPLGPARATLVDVPDAHGEYVIYGYPFAR